MAKESSYINHSNRRCSATGGSFLKANLDKNDVKALSTEEMIDAAREASKSACDMNYDNEYDFPAAAALNANLCMLYYTSKLKDEEDVQKLVELIKDRKEHRLFRVYLIGLVSEEKTSRNQCSDIFSTYLKTNRDNIEEVIFDIAKDKAETFIVRRYAMDFVGTTLSRRYGSLVHYDKNMTEIRRKSKKRIDKWELIEKGEIQLTSETLEALKPIEKKILKASDVSDRLYGAIR